MIKSRLTKPKPSTKRAMCTVVRSAASEDRQAGFKD